MAEAAFPGMNLTETLLTQWRSSVGTLNPSPLNTWPKCPPHAAHVISVLLPSGSAWKSQINFHYNNSIPNLQLFQNITPETVSILNTYEAIDCSRKTLEESRPTTTRIKFGSRLVKRSSTASTIVNPFFIKLVILSSTLQSAQS